MDFYVVQFHLCIEIVKKAKKEKKKVGGRKKDESYRERRKLREGRQRERGEGSDVHIKIGGFGKCVKNFHFLSFTQLNEHDFLTFHLSPFLSIQTCFYNYNDLSFSLFSFIFILFPFLFFSFLPLNSFNQKRAQVYKKLT